MTIALGAGERNTRSKNMEAVLFIWAIAIIALLVVIFCLMVTWGIENREYKRFEKEHTCQNCVHCNMIIDYKCCCNKLDVLSITVPSYCNMFEKKENK